jgi:hypothetical protein
VGKELGTMSAAERWRYGTEEVEQGRPFVGNAGKLLDKLLE